MKTNEQTLTVEIIPVEDGFAYDIHLNDENATVGQYIRLLDEFLDAKVAPCIGCDLCCCQRIPLTLPDLYGYAGKEKEAIAAFLKEKAEVRYHGKAVDVKVAQRDDDSCIFLDRDNQRCLDHLHRSLVCHTYICLPQTERARNLREELINEGEDALIGALYALDLLEDQGRSENYPIKPLWQEKTFDEIRLRDALSPSVFAALL